jgi:RNA polymerase sigma-70 factor (ECF subfamily)
MCSKGGKMGKKPLRRGRRPALIMWFHVLKQAKKRHMKRQSGYIRLVKQAQLGDRQSLDRLAESARERLRVYVYRLTLEEDVAQEIVQESMLEMCKVLGKLKKADRFWPWLYGIATNKLRRHKRSQRVQERAAASRAKQQGRPKHRNEGFEKLVSDELKQIVATAMQGLRTRHRAVLIMRCYDGMSYEEIAESMGCSEFGTRMLFLRAKRALAKQLARNGFGKKSLLGALVVFGKMTAPTEAAAGQISVTAATTQVGFLAGLVGLATSKTAIVSLSTAGVLTVGTVVGTSQYGQGIAANSHRPTESPPAVSLLENHDHGTEEYWYFFPEGPQGPLMLRGKPAGRGGQPYSYLLQNDLANYYYRNRAVHVNNHRMWSGDLRVARLPTDSPQLSSFLSRVEGPDGKMQYVSATGRGLLVIAKRDLEGDDSHSWAVRHYNVLDEDYFQCDWPAGTKIIDSRDAMHKRGWTYFRVTGRVNEKLVSGTGRIPFVYATSRRYAPWLTLQVGDELRIVDVGGRASLRGPKDRLIADYEGGSFFKGLPRPWMGLHTIDIVRRDAAEQSIWFETTYTSDDEYAEIELTYDQTKLIYAVDLKRDVLDGISFWVGGNNRGNLRFDYLRSIDSADTDFVKPRQPGHRRAARGERGVLWLLRLAEGTLGK